MFGKATLCLSLVLAAACGSNAPEATPRAQQSAAQPASDALPVLRAPLPELRTWFDAHRGEARFIAILSPS